MGAGYMHTGYYFGFFLAALANYVIGARFGWRWMFVLGGTPALLVGWIQSGVQESAGWKAKFENPAARPRMRDSFAALFAPRFLRRTVTMSLLFMVSIIGLWAGSIYVPTAVTQIALREGHTGAEAAKLASYGGAVLSIGTIIGCLLAPVISEAVGRRVAMAGYYVLMFIGIAFGFGSVFYWQNALMPFFVLIFILGLGGANFAVFTLWIPEQYTTECRGSAIGFTSSVGRFVGVAMVFLVGAGIQRFGSLGVPVALTAAAFIIGLFVLPAATETKGQPLPI
jgi:MFS family permease